jgi:hypothetical protein
VLGSRGRCALGAVEEGVLDGSGEVVIHLKEALTGVVAKFLIPRLRLVAAAVGFSLRDEIAASACHGAEQISDGRLTLFRVVATRTKIGTGIGTGRQGSRGF